MELAIKSIESREDEELVGRFFGYLKQPSFSRCEGTVLTGNFKECANDILTFQVRDDDIWVCSFPKCGTTWTQEMVWCIANNVDLEGAKVKIQQRFLWLERDAITGYKLKSYIKPESYNDTITRFNNAPSPRFIKSHLPFHLLPLQLQQRTTKAKIVYVSRNAKDSCVSFYYHCKTLGECPDSIEDFARLFINDAVLYGPYWGHTIGYWKRQNPENLLFIKYEDMKQDLPSVVKKTSEFLGKSLTEHQISTLCHHLSFDEMKNNKAVNCEEVWAEVAELQNLENSGRFMRSGKVGDWKTKLSPESIQRFDKWIEKNRKDLDLPLELC